MTAAFLSNETLHTRSATQQLEFNTRSNVSFVSTFDDSTRSIEIVLATETPTQVFDFERRQVLDEVLLVRGMDTSVSELPLLDNHNRFDNDAVFGLINNIRVAESKGEVRARMTFADMQEFLEKYPQDEQARKLERTVLKVRQGVLKGISAGYKVVRSVYVPAGERRVIQGKEFKARANVGMSVVTEWVPREGSITPVQADRFSMTRSETKGVHQMPPKLRKRLEALGMRADATQDEAWVFYHGLQDSQRSELSDVTEGVDIPSVESTRSEVEGTQLSSEVVDQIRQIVAEGIGNNAGGDGASADGELDLATQVRNAVNEQLRTNVQDERDRVRQINDLFQGAEPELHNRAISEGWDYETAARELVPRLRSGYRPAVGGDVSGDASGGNLGVHTRGSDDVTEDVLAGALMMRTGADVEHNLFANPQLTDGRIRCSGLLGSIDSDERQQVLERANRIRRISAVDICQRALELRNITDFDRHNPDEIVQRALSSGAVTNIFSSDVSARLLASYADAGDTTLGWVVEEDVANFKKNERTGMGKFKGLTKHARGGTAKHDYIDDEKEEYRIAKYSDQYVLDEQDIIDDSLGGLQRMTPSDLGNAAAQLRPDLVYAMIHANANMRDGVALFHASHNNLRTGAATALGIPALEAAEIAFGKQKIGTRTLNLSIGYLVIPRDLRWKAAQIMRSVERREAESADGTANPISGENITIRFDDRMGANGVVDPDTETSYAGSATNYLITARPGDRGARTFVCGYRQGTGRAPRIRSFVLNQGSYGMGWDIDLDIGVKALDWRAVQWNAGA